MVVRHARRGTQLSVLGSTAVWMALAFAFAAAAPAAAQPAAAPTTTTQELNDSHLHLWNYIQKGPTIQVFLKVMGTQVGRVAIFGLPLQQMWSYGNSGDFAPWYYTQTDAPLYYYSFTDAALAMAYRSLTPEQRARFDPMIIGFNPADMYAADHIRRVLTTFPGVFSGIGEFTIHKEFVSAKTAGGAASLTDPALDHVSFDLVGRDRQVPDRDPRDDRGGGGHDQPAPRPVSAWDRRDGADGAGKVPQGLRHVRPALRAAHARGVGEGAEGQLRTAVRQGEGRRARLGESECALIRSPGQRKGEKR
jgi:hypothetical protein